MRSLLALIVPTAALLAFAACGGETPPAASPSPSASDSAAPAPSAGTSAAPQASSDTGTTPPAPSGTAVVIPQASPSSSPDNSDPSGIKIRYDVVVGLGGLEMESPIANVGPSLKPLIFASRACYLKALERDGSIGGKIALVLKVGKSGDVLSAGAGETTVGAATTSCVVAAGRAQKFDADTSRPASVKLGLTLSFKRQR